MSPKRALDDVVGPEVVMIARTPLWTLHSTVAGEKVTTKTLWNAVGFILAHELITLHS